MALPDPSHRILPDNWQLLAPLLDQVLDTTPDQRDARLAELSGGDPARRAELEALVAECERADPLLDRPAAEGFAALFEDEAVRLPEVLGDRYRIVRELGRGGMAVVFLARDLKHGREVAVKVVHPELATALGRTRFLREIEIAARLHHPHIVPLFDSGVADDLLYYVMPFEPGSSLRERLARDGPLPVDDAIRILREVCGALVHAHRQGIVHRDIKPENVLLSDRHAMVTDFGVAKAVRDATGREAVTTGGVTLGTPAYMAPEQIAADRHVDHRADIYAVGVLGYEVLTGRPPFEGETGHEVLSAHLTQAPEPLSSHRPDVPQALDDLIMKSLQKRPADRWQRAEELLAQLDALPTPSGGGPRVAAPRARWTARHATALGIAAGLLALALFVAREPRPEAVSSAVPSIAVLPFTSPAASAGEAGIADGMTEDLITKLAQGGSIRVISATSAFALRDRKLDVRTLADSLGAAHVVEGSVTKSGDTLRVNVRLIDARDGSMRWTQMYTRELREIFAVQDEIVQSVAQQLDVPRMNSAAKTRVPSPEYMLAHELYAQARDPLLNRSSTGARQRVELLNRAIQADSTYAPAYAALAHTYLRAQHAGPIGMPLREAVDRAERMAQKALTLDSTLAFAFDALGLTRLATYRFVEAEPFFRRALELDPTLGKAREHLVWLYSFMGRREAALREARLGAQYDPLSPHATVELARALLLNDRCSAALEQIALIERLTPPLLRAAPIAAQCYAREKKWPVAIEKLRQVKDRAVYSDPVLIYLLAHAGQRAAAVSIRDSLVALAESGQGYAFPVALAHASLGDFAAAFHWLDRSLEDYSFSFTVMEPAFAELRQQPEFARVAKRIGIEHW